MKRSRPRRRARDVGDPPRWVSTLSPEYRPKHRRSPFGSLVAAAGVTALLIVGLSPLAVSAVIGSGGGGLSRSGGPPARRRRSPRGSAGRRHGAGTERSALAAQHGQAAKRAAELKLAGPASASLAGVDFNVENLVSSRRRTLADGFAKVTVGPGEFSASTHEGEVAAHADRRLATTR